MSVNDQTAGKGAVRKLGRGLTALMGTPVQILSPGASSANRAGVGSTPPAAAPALDHASAAIVPGLTPDPQEVHVGLREIPVEQITPNRRQPRTDFDPASLQALAASIRTAGLMQPVMVRPLNGGFELVAGERRWRAAKLIGLQVIPAVVREVDDQSAAEMAIIENVQREDLNPMERAVALRRLVDEYGLTHQQVADKVGLDRASVSNLLRLSDLDRSTADLVRAGKLSQGHAKALLSLTDASARAQLAARVVSEEWSVRELERRIQLVQKGGAALKAPSDSMTSPEVNARDANVADLERQLAEHLGTRVSIQLGRKKGSGRLTIDFYNLDQFDGLMQKIGFGSRRA